MASLNNGYMSNNLHAITSTRHFYLAFLLSSFTIPIYMFNQALFPNEYAHEW